MEVLPGTCRRMPLRDCGAATGGAGIAPASVVVGGIGGAAEDDVDGNGNVDVGNGRPGVGI